MKLSNPLTKLREHTDLLREYERISGFSEQARRALANNGFDGMLTTIGLLVGSYVAGIRDAQIIIHTGLATAMAMAISGAWGAYLAEGAERRRDLAELEGIALTDLGQSKIGRASRVAVVVVAAVDGVSPLVAALIVLTPMFAWPQSSDIRYAYASCLLVAMIGLFGLGMFLGRISSRSMLLYGLRTIVAGLVSMALGFLLGAL
jgi:predicted membrane protein (TIGR00267 family)